MDCFGRCAFLTMTTKNLKFLGNFQQIVKITLLNPTKNFTNFSHFLAFTLDKH